jgi:glycosyltransferase involved in cell wall biosynthesis
MKLRLAIDVTAARTDGLLGGRLTAAVYLILALLKQQRKMEIFLLTAAESHDFFVGLVGSKRVIQVLPETTNEIDNGKKPEPRPESKPEPGLWQQLRALLAGWGPAAPLTLQTLQADLLFCPLGAVSPFLKDLPLLQDLPRIVQIHELQHEYYPQFFSPADCARLKKEFGELCEQAAALVVASQFSKNLIVEKYAIPADRIQVIPFGVPERLLKQQADKETKLVDGLGLQGRKYLYYPADVWPHKNHDILLVAFNLLVRSGSDLQLVFTGSLTDSRPVLRAAVQQMGLQERVHFLGPVTDRQKAAILKDCHCLVFPSLFEGFGLPLLEAMAFRRPIVCSDNTSLPDTAGDAALYFDPRKPEQLCAALRRLDEEPGLYRRLQERGANRLREVDSERMADAYSRLFRQWRKQP